MELKEIIKVIEDMDPAEADAMGVSCTFFAAKLIEEFYEKFGATVHNPPEKCPQSYLLIKPKDWKE
jgi:hypothetical protein